MVTLGVDLAAEPKNTGACAIEWRNGRASVDWILAGLQDDEILSRARTADVVGVDAPFGWPSDFVAAITAHHTGQRWPIVAWDKLSRRKLRLRVTDERVHEFTGITPLSVSSDAIAIPATRCAALVDRLGVVDRSGDGHVFEVYPAAALFQWGLRSRGYMDERNSGLLRELLSTLRERTPWLNMAPAQEQFCGACDDAFDALVASLVARAASRGTSSTSPGATCRRRRGSLA